MLQLISKNKTLRAEPAVIKRSHPEKQHPCLLRANSVIHQEVVQWYSKAVLSLPPK
jgi:hypothetical protein